MPIKDVKYKYDQTILKVYGYGDNKKIKITRMNVLRTAGIEDEKERVCVRGTINDEKLEESVIRAKNKIFELAYCNPWQFFFTGTIDSNKYNRTDLGKYHKDLTKWFANQGQKFGCKIDFLLIPELHSDGHSWHIHGFINNLPTSEVKQFKVGDTMGKALAEKVKKGHIVYNWQAYQNKFGFCDLEPIRNPEAVSKYITKYVNKNLATSVTELNAHLYYHSRGLQTAKTIRKGNMTAPFLPTFQNDYCIVAWIDYTEESLRYYEQSFVDIDYYKTRRNRS